MTLNDKFLQDDMLRNRKRLGPLAWIVIFIAVLFVLACVLGAYLLLTRNVSPLLPAPKANPTQIAERVTITVSSITVTPTIKTSQVISWTVWSTKNPLGQTIYDGPQEIKAWVMRDYQAAQKWKMDHLFERDYLLGHLSEYFTDKGLEKERRDINVRQLELEDALAIAAGDIQEIQTGIQSALISDALELQLAEQYLAQLETAAPDVATTVRLVATAQENLAVALQAVKDGLLRDAAMLLEKAKAGNADPTQVAEAEQQLADARKNQTARDLIARLNANLEQPGAVRRIRRLVEEAESAGVTNLVTPHANRALETARRAANARYAQARPIADHLASEGFVPVVGDGRIEVWQEISRNGASARFDARSAAQHGTVWTLDRVMMLRGQSWETETPRVPITRRELPKRVQNSRWFNHHLTGQNATAQ